jgi:hypothetical protein
MLVDHIFQDVAVEQLRAQLVGGFGAQPAQDGPASALECGAAMAVQLERAELPLHRQDAWLQAGLGLER